MAFPTSRSCRDARARGIACHRPFFLCVIYCKGSCCCLWILAKKVGVWWSVVAGQRARVGWVGRGLPCGVGSRVGGPELCGVQLRGRGVGWAASSAGGVPGGSRPVYQLNPRRFFELPGYGLPRRRVSIVASSGRCFIRVPSSYALTALFMANSSVMPCSFILATYRLL